VGGWGRIGGTLSSHTPHTPHWGTAEIRAK
jgi:hypothetical protein